MARDLGLDAVVDHFTLVGDERDQLRNKAGATRLGFALSLKFLLWRGRFPRGRYELADDAVEHVARQVGVAGDVLGSYDMTSRTAQRHRSEIRRYTGFRECSVADAERREDRVREGLLARCRSERLEPPSADRVRRARAIRAAPGGADAGDEGRGTPRPGDQRPAGGPRRRGRRA
jgi:hypothetical protein